jgi:hypothetical protein
MFVASVVAVTSALGVPHLRKRRALNLYWTFNVM